MGADVTTFVIEGRCPTKGSTKSFAHPSTGRIVTLPMNKNLKAWTRSARLQALAAKVPMIYKPHGVKLDVLVEFVKPKTSKALVPSVRPDADKLLRAVLDMLTGIAYADDSQVVQVTTTKAYGPSERVTVQIERAA